MLNLKMKNIKIYINSWIKILKNAEKQPNIGKEWLRKRNYFQIKKGRYEFFEAKIPLLNLKIFFDIENIKEYFKEISDIEEVKVKDYLDGKINLIANPKYKYKMGRPSERELNEPICVIPLVSSFVVINGNHRLGNFISNNKEVIVCKFISEEVIVEHSSFLSDFDKYVYILFNEVYYLSQSKEGDINKILKSFLCKGRVWNSSNNCNGNIIQKLKLKFFYKKYMEDLIDKHIKY